MSSVSETHSLMGRFSPQGAEELIQRKDSKVRLVSGNLSQKESSGTWEGQGRGGLGVCMFLNVKQSWGREKVKTLGFQVGWLVAGDCRFSLLQIHTYPLLPFLNDRLSQTRLLP